jgi:hypothetical protein
MSSFGLLEKIKKLSHVHLAVKLKGLHIVIFCFNIGFNFKVAFLFYSNISTYTWAQSKCYFINHLALWVLCKAQLQFTLPASITSLSLCAKITSQHT